MDPKGQRFDGPGETVRNEESFERAATFLDRGGVLIYPTETFYGLGGNPRMEPVVDRIYRIKGRDSGKALPLIASDLAAVREAVSLWPEAADRLASAFWPGPLTLLLPAAPSLPPVLQAGTGRIAVRISSHPIARALADRTGGLLIATSANRSGEPACREISDIPTTLAGLVDFVLDGGKLPGGLPSTIVSVSPTGLTLVRAGCISFEDVLGVGRN